MNRGCLCKFLIKNTRENYLKWGARLTDDNIEERCRGDTQRKGNPKRCSNVAEAKNWVCRRTRNKHKDRRDAVNEQYNNELCIMSYRVKSMTSVLGAGRQVELTEQRTIDTASSPLVTFTKRNQKEK